MTVIESTSGNTGIALAAVAVSRGYPCVVVMPDNASRERLLTLRMLGAQVEFTDHVLGFQGCVDRAKELHAAVPGSWYACQHENTANIAAHYTTTGPEIWEGTGGAVDVLVCGVGTGGTLTGTGRYLRERNPGLRIVAVEPEGSPCCPAARLDRTGFPASTAASSAPSRTSPSSTTSSACRTTTRPT